MFGLPWRVSFAPAVLLALDYPAVGIVLPWVCLRCLGWLCWHSIAVRWYWSVCGVSAGFLLSCVGIVPPSAVFGLLDKNKKRLPPYSHREADKQFM